MRNTVSTFLAILFIVGIFTWRNTTAQTLDETLNSLSQTAGEAYVNPIVSAFGSNLNAAWFKGVPEATFFGFNIELKIAGIGTMFSNENKTFSTSGKFHFTDAQVDQILANSGITSSNPFYASTRAAMLEQEFEVNISGPTIVGSGSENVVVDFPQQTVNGQNISGYQVVLNGVSGVLEDMAIFPSVAAQLAIGTIYGTEAYIRYFPEMDIPDVGKFKMFGFGFMHNPEVWFPNPLPIDIGVGFFTQTLEVGKNFSSTATQFGLFASKTFGILASITPYLGLTLESSTTTVKYDYVFYTPVGKSQSSISMDLIGKNNFGVTIGADVHLVFINFFVDYKMATYNTVSGGVSFGF